MNVAILDRRIAAARESLREWIASRAGLPPDGWIGDRVDAACPVKVGPHPMRFESGPGSLRQRVLRAAMVLGPGASGVEVARKAGAAQEARRVACCLAHLRKQGLLPYSGRRRPRAES